MAYDRFPLMLWEETEEFKKYISEAEHRFLDIRKRLDSRGFRCTYLGDLRISAEGKPEVWLNSSNPVPARRIKDAPMALELANKYGSSSWWTLDELEHFSNGQGIIIERAMWDLGYRKHKQKIYTWAKVKKNDTLTSIAEQKDISVVVGEEYERLQPLWTFQNEFSGVGKTYQIQVGKRGLIYISLMVNPFAGSTYETMWMLGNQSRRRGHLAEQQQGFNLLSKNVQLHGEHGVYIKATKPDTTFQEFVWPTNLPSSKLYDLAHDLVSRIK